MPISKVSKDDIYAMKERLNQKRRDRIAEKDIDEVVKMVNNRPFAEIQKSEEVGTN